MGCKLPTLPLHARTAESRGTKSVRSASSSNHSESPLAFKAKKILLGFNVVIKLCGAKDSHIILN